MAGVRRQCTTSPACDKVKPVKTPMAYSGMSVRVLPLTATSRAPDRIARVQIPDANTCRSSRSAYRWGR
jgi:hypothetical protein